MSEAQSLRLSRRGFLAATAGAIAAPSLVPSPALGRDGAVPPSERIVIGVIGVGGMGRGNARGFMCNPDARVVAVCDVDRLHLDRAAAEVNSHYENEDCARYTDYRELLARSDIDAVCVATPDHWHALCAIAAARAGKDIYCQKPITHTFSEGQALVRAVREAGVVLQVGSQQRSQSNFRRAVEVVLNGHIGRVREVQVGLPTGPTEPRGDTREQDPPPQVDYELWCGPSPRLPFVPARFHGNWRWHRAYGGGQLMDWIGHHNDIAHWGLGMDRGGPLEVRAVGFEYPRDRHVYNAAWKYELRCVYEGGISTSISNRHERGCKWIGEEGWVFVARGKLRASDPRWTRDEFAPGPTRVYRSAEHHRNFLDCVKTRQPCICPAETGHRSITPGHLGLVSEALGARAIRWDPGDERILDDPEAETLLKTLDYRPPWTLGA